MKLLLLFLTSAVLANTTSIFDKLNDKSGSLITKKSDSSCEKEISIELYPVLGYEGNGLIIYKKTKSGKSHKTLHILPTQNLSSDSLGCKYWNSRPDYNEAEVIVGNDSAKIDYKYYCDGELEHQILAELSLNDDTLTMTINSQVCRYKM